jgi:predicted nucleic acid-binding protein
LTIPAVFFDTNILVYPFSQSAAKTAVARNLLGGGGVVSIQILNEFAAVMRTKLKLDLPRVRRQIEDVMNNCPDPRPLTPETHRAGMRLCERYGFSIYDGTMIASALEANCTILYTEDLHHGQLINGLRIENPFLG